MGGLLLHRILHQLRILKQAPRSTRETPMLWDRGLLFLLIFAVMASASAEAQRAQVSGACGPASGTDLTSQPTTNLCSAGTASAVTGTGPWMWTCGGANGGRTASCQALAGQEQDPTTGVLPPYDDVHTNWANAGMRSVGGIPQRTTVCATVSPL